MSFLRIILLSFNYVIIKYTMEEKFASPYEIALFNGIINLFLFIIFSILDWKFFLLYDYEKYFNNFNFKELLVVLGEMITQFGIYICLFLSDNNHTPCHLFIIFVFGQLAYDFNFTWISILVIICLIIILFFSLIFNEIIEINLWGLSHNTKRNITIRAVSEGIDTLFFENETIDDKSENNINDENSQSREIEID